MGGWAGGVVAVFLMLLSCALGLIEFAPCALKLLETVWPATAAWVAVAELEGSQGTPHAVPFCNGAMWGPHADLVATRQGFLLHRCLGLFHRACASSSAKKGLWVREASI